MTNIENLAHDLAIEYMKLLVANNQLAVTYAEKDQKEYVDKYLCIKEVIYKELLAKDVC